MREGVSIGGEGVEGIMKKVGTGSDGGCSGGRLLFMRLAFSGLCC